MSYQIKDTGAERMRFQIIRPGEAWPSFYVNTESQAREVIEIDEKLSSGVLSAGDALLGIVRSMQADQSGSIEKHHDQAD